MPTTQSMPSAEIVFDTLFAYQRSAALKAAIDLDLFTTIDQGAGTVSAMASQCGASERGLRILCDYLVTLGLLTKSGAMYQLTPEAAAFLSKQSPAYLGTTARFLLRPELKNNFEHLTDVVRLGSLPPAANNIVSEENPIWIEFARSMMPMMVPAAHAIAGLVGTSSGETVKVLDIAAGHGLFGITIAQRHPRAEITAVDWGPVLSLAEENARAAGVHERYRTLAGDAFKVDFGGGYDVALLTNFLHHFDEPTCIAFLRKVHAALNRGGRVVILEFVPNEDRVSPPMAARFSLTMLAETPGGDAYTFRQLQQQLETAGFRNVSAHPLPTPQMVLLADK
jgi:2-polyprenyl-3-methyl-5-hydroxy-6-metoxy-1,4-benzoquinol methylase